MDEKQCRLVGGKPDKVCMVDGFPTATGKEIETPILHEWIEQCQILHLRPEDFLKIVPSTIYTQSIIDDLKEKIRKRQPLDIPFIEMKEEDFGGLLGKVDCIEGHEGRHRAQAARELGLPYIPVLLCKRR
jgi:hypothetical protein